MCTSGLWNHCEHHLFFCFVHLLTNDPQQLMGLQWRVRVDTQVGVSAHVHATTDWRTQVFTERSLSWCLSCRQADKLLRQFACAQGNENPQAFLMHVCVLSWTVCCVRCVYSPSLVSVCGLLRCKLFSFKLSCWYICLLWQGENSRMSLYVTEYFWFADSSCISAYTALLYVLCFSKALPFGWEDSHPQCYKKQVIQWGPVKIGMGGKQKSLSRYIHIYIYPLTVSDAGASGTPSDLSPV